jgi:hypothetical protein
MMSLKLKIKDFLISHRRERKLKFSRPIIKITRPKNWDNFLPKGRPWTSADFGPFGTECGSKAKLAFKI